MYDASGSFQIRVDVCAKSGVSGVLLCVVPGKLGFATFSPRLDNAGNSVFGVEFCKSFVRKIRQEGIGGSAIQFARPLLKHNRRRLAILFLNAAARGDKARLRELVALGVSPYATDYDGRNALHLAANQEITEFLLRLGVDPEAIDRFGNTAMPANSASPNHNSSTAPFNDFHERTMLSRDSSEEFEPPIAFQVGDDEARFTLVEENIRMSMDYDESVIPECLRNKGVDPNVFYDPKLPLRDMHPVVMQTLSGNLAVPDWKRFTEFLERTSIDIAQEEEKDSTVGAPDYSIPLASSPLEDFAVGFTSVDCQVCIKGNNPDKEISLQSVFKPFALAIALQEFGFDLVEQKVSYEPSGRPFKDMSLDWRGRPFNPMMNSGGLAIISMLFPECIPSKKMEKFIHYLCRCSGEKSFKFSHSVFLGEMHGAEDRLKAIAHRLRNSGVLPRSTSLKQLVEYYCLITSITVNVRQASALASCLANGGVCPFTRERVFSEDVTRRVLMLMLSSGLAEYSGTHSFEIGVPCQSGVSGLTIGVVPGVGGFAVVSSGLDSSFNSVKGNHFFQNLASAARVHQFDNNQRKYADGWSLDRYYLENEHLLLGDLMYAAARGDIWFLKELLSMDVVKVNDTDYDGRTVLHCACAEGHLDLVRVLIEMGARPELKDNFGRTPLSDALEFGHHQTATFLESLENVATKTLNGY